MARRVIGELLKSLPTDQWNHSRKTKKLETRSPFGTGGLELFFSYLANNYLAAFRGIISSIIAV